MLLEGIVATVFVSPNGFCSGNRFVMLIISLSSFVEGTEMCPMNLLDALRNPNTSHIKLHVGEYEINETLYLPPGAILDGSLHNLHAPRLTSSLIRALDFSHFTLEKGNWKRYNPDSSENKAATDSFTSLHQ